jgi:hypothetical protein
VNNFYSFYLRSHFFHTHFNHMGKKDPEDEIFEFRIKFYHSGSDFINQRHFMALNHSSALNMFDFASRKDSIEVELIGLDRWNRWADRWEPCGELVDEEVDLVP